MKAKWEYKPLGDVGTVVGGSTPKTNILEYWNGGNYWVTPAELKGDKYIDSTERTISDIAVAKTNLTLLPAGTVLLSSRAPIGKVCITRSPMYCNQGFKNIICSEKLYNEYLYWWLKGRTSYLNSLGVGATFKEISKRVVEQIVVPVPPLDEQQRIAAELDLLTSIIDKQKTQLKEFDTLAQSIFYDMFGDPIENEKGWEVFHLEDVVVPQCSLSYGIVQPGDDLPNGVPIVRPVDLTTTFVSRKNLKCTAKEISDSYKRTILTGSEVLLCVRGTTGIVALATDELCGCNVSRGIVPILLKDDVDRFLLYYILMSKAMNQLVQEKTHGIALKGINVADVRLLPVIIPPVKLQQEFADKIQSIEMQKAAVNQSIVETQKLLDYTMEKYFG